MTYQELSVRPARETKEVTSCIAFHRPFVLPDIRRATSKRPQRRHPPLPHRRHHRYRVSEVSGIINTYFYIDPHRVFWVYKNRSSARATTNHLKPMLINRKLIEDVARLSRAKHKGCGRWNAMHDTNTSPPNRRDCMQVSSRRSSVQRLRLQLATGRYARHAEGIRETPTTTHAGDFGATDGRFKNIPASSGVRSRLARLHGLHAATRFSQLCEPPRDRGMT
jgi:hypothetical protein